MTEEKIPNVELIANFSFSPGIIFSHRSTSLTKQYTECCRIVLSNEICRPCINHM